MQTAGNHPPQIMRYDIEVMLACADTYATYLTDSDGGKVSLPEGTKCTNIVGRMSASSMVDVVGCFVLYDQADCQGTAQMVDNEVISSYPFETIKSASLCKNQ